MLAHTMRPIVLCGFLIFVIILLGVGGVAPVERQASAAAPVQTTPTEKKQFLPLIRIPFGKVDAPADLVASTLLDMPATQPLSCEHPYTTRLTTNNFVRGLQPQTMNFSACQTDTDAPTLFTSLTLAKNNDGTIANNQSGMLVQSQLNPATNKLEVVRQRAFPECKELMGIDTSNSCGVIGVLCRTAPTRTDYTKDIVATHWNPDNWLKDVIAGRDQMWLYEWTNGDIRTEPAKYIVHKAIGSWEYGLYNLVYGENDDSYGISLKSTRNGHEADSMTVVDRKTYSLVPKRGWDWSCGGGHTLYNRLGYNPATKQYGLLCGTDSNNLNAGAYGSISFTTETKEKPNFLLIQQQKLRDKGGPGALHPLPDGGWVGVIVGAAGNLAYAADSQTPAAPPTQIGLVTFNQAGDLVGPINWIVSTAPYYTSYPQLVPLENGNYLLGYGRMPANSDLKSYQAELHWQLFFPEEYWLQEIDVNGRPVSNAWRLNGVAWGELDEMVSLGKNRVAWATAYMDRLTGRPDDSASQQPDCNADQLQLNVYQSPKQ